MPPSPSPSLLWRAAGALGLALAVASAGACTSSGSDVTSGAPAAPSATSGSGSSGGSTTAKSPATKAPTTKPPGSKAPTTSADVGDDSTTTDLGALTPACELLPEEDVVEAFGEPVTAGEQDRDECWWSTKNDLKTVNLIRRTEQDLDEWRSGYQNSSWTKVDLGDEGYAGKVLDTITFRIGDTTYEVNVVFSTKGDPEQVVQDLTDKVTTRL